MLDPETRGERAGQILEDPVFQDSVEGAKTRIKDTWAKEASEEARSRLWHKLQAIDTVAAELRIIRDNGVKLRADRERKEKRGDG